MKNSFNLSMMALSLLVGGQTLADVNMSASKSACCPKEEKKHPKKQHCKSYVNITAHDINHASRNSAQGLVLDKPNTNYKLCENVLWKNKIANSFAITIAADNITLDLDGHLIKQRDITFDANFAVHVLGSTSYTTIKNGTLQQLSGGGILVDAGAYAITLDALACNESCYGGQVTVVPPVPGLNSSAACFLFNGSPENPILNITITNCRFTNIGVIGVLPVWFTGTITNNTTLTLEEEPLYPINLGFVLENDGAIAGTIVSQESPTQFTITSTENTGPVPMVAVDPNGTYIPFGNVSFVYAAFTTDLTMDNCIGNGNFGDLFSFALFFVKSSFLNITNIDINNPQTFVLCKGMEFFGCDNAIVEDCNISNLVMNFTPIANAFPFGHGSEGIKCGSSTDCIFRRINFSGCRVQTQVPTAFAAPTAYADCCGIFYDVISGVGPLRNILVEDCTAVDMVSDGGRAFGNPSYTAGFNNSSAILFAPPVVEEMNNLRYENCSVSGLYATLGWAYGFGSVPEPNFLAIENDISYTNCVAEDITISGSGIFAAGYVLTAERNIIRNCRANRVLDERENPQAYGVLLEDLGGGQEARASIVAGNTLTNCSTTGILDRGLAVTNVINSNYAALNGFAGTGPNYSGLSASNTSLIQDWPLAGVPAAPPVGGPVLANVSVHN